MNVLSIFLLAIFILAPALSTRAQDHNSKLVEGAKKEGKLVVYTSMNQRDATLLVQEFKKRYPFIDGQIFRANSHKLLSWASTLLLKIRTRQSCLSIFSCPETGRKP